MIPQLVQNIIKTNSVPKVDEPKIALDILTSDPFDLLLYMEQTWDSANTLPGSTSPEPAREALWSLGQFRNFPPVPGDAWDHLGYGYVLENTRVIQILRRVVREYRTGEGLGIPSLGTQRWLNATETLLFGAANPLTSWLSTSNIRQDAEAVRRNAYWRLFGLDLAFGGDDNGPPVYDKTRAANTGFVPVFEELLFELWQAISNVRNTSGSNNADDDRIYRLSEQLKYELLSRRKSNMLKREELSAATVLGWADLTLRFDSPIVVDLRAQASSAGERLSLIGERVGLPAHSKSASFFSMASDLSIFLRSIEAGLVAEPELAWILYLEQQPATTTPPQPSDPPLPKPIGSESRRVITEWAAATGKDLKSRGKPVELSRPRLMAVQ